MSSEESSNWARVSREEAFITPIFKLFKERSRCLRTGVEGDFYYFSCVSWVNVIALEKASGKLLMIKQYRHGSGRKELEIPGGGIDSRFDMTPVEAAERELLEETGYRGSDGRIIGRVCPNPALQGNYCYTVLLTDAERITSPLMELTEDIETVKISFDDVMSHVAEGKITHGLVLNAINFFDLYRHGISVKV